MNFYEFNEKLKKEKLLNEQGFVRQLGNMIGQGFQGGADALQRSMKQGFQQIGDIQNAKQMKIDAKGMKDVEDHMQKVATTLGIDPKELQQEIKALVSKIEEIKSRAPAPAEAPAQSNATVPQNTSSPAVGGDWSSFQV